MKCTVYAKDERLTQASVSKVVAELRKKSGKSNIPNKELEPIAREAIVLHNRANNIKEAIGDVITYYEADSNNMKIADAESVDISANGVISVHTNKGTLRFVEHGVNVIGQGIRSYDVESAITTTPRYPTDHDTLYNVDASEAAIDTAFGTSDTTYKGDVKAIQAELAKIDKDSSNSTWDPKHSQYLQVLMEKMTNTVAEVKNLKVKVTKEVVKELIEPLGGFSPSNKDKIRIATANIQEQARNRFIMGNEEALAHETTHAYLYVLFHKRLGVLGQDVKDDIRRLYSLAKSKLTYKDLLPEDGGPYSKEEEQKAKEMYDYIFTGKLNDTSLNDANVRLQEFMVYGLTNRYFKKALSDIAITYNKVKVPDGVSVLAKIFYKLMDKLKSVLFTIKTRHNRNSDIDKELTRLAMKLGEINYVYGGKAKTNIGVSIDEKFSGLVNNITSDIDNHIKDTITSITDKIGVTVSNDSKSTAAETKYLLDLVDKARDSSKKILNGGLLTKVYNYPRLALILTKVYTTISDSDKDEYLRLRIKMDEISRITFGKMYNFIQDLIKDFTAGRKTLVEITDRTMMFKSHLDRMRDMNMKGVLKEIQVGFKNIDIFHPKNIKYSHALNRVILRTDFQAVGRTADTLLKYLDEDSRTTEVSRLEELIKAYTVNGVNVGERMLKEASSVANYMLTHKGLRSNADNISKNFGVYASFEVQTNLNYNIDTAASNIDKLISLYALGRVESTYIDTIKELIDKDKNGVSNYLLLSKGANVAIKSEWQTAGRYQEFVKGQLKEKTDFSSELIYASVADHEKLKDLGYELVEALITDNGDITKSMYALYSHSNTGVTKRVDGALGLQRISIKGLLLSDKVRAENEGLEEELLHKKISIAIAKAKNSNYSQMYPVYAADGSIIDYRYEPSLAKKEVYLNLEKRGTELLATTFSQKDTQAYTDTNNKKLIDIIMDDTKRAIKQLKKEMYIGDPLKSGEFVKVYATEHKLTTVELKQKEADKSFPQTQGEVLWGLLPPNARKYIIDVNKKEDIANGIVDPKPRKEIYIRKDLMKQLFGYNEAMVSNNKFVKMLPLKIQRQLRITEKVAADIMSIAKSMAVVKLPRTVINNITSNAKFLWFSGIPAVKSAEYLLLSKKSLDKWHVDEHKRMELKRKIDMSESSDEEFKLKKMLADLEVEMQDNPLNPLISVGLYQTIVDDVNMEDDNNMIVNWAEKKFAESPFSDSIMIRDVVENIFLTRRSMLGQLLLHITQEGDFHFRAAIYWYAIENGKNHEEALRDVIDNFINYSKVINSKTIQWLDRMGPEAFWKYFANIQRVGLKLIKQNTTKVILDTTAKHYLNVPSDVLDSAVVFNWNKRLNPLSWLDNTVSLLDNAAEIPAMQLVDGF